MSETKFTPGPWRACGEERGGCKCCQVWSTSADMPVATAARETEQSILPEPDLDTAKANARLVAAAPDLYEALEEICVMQERNYGDGAQTHMDLIGLASKARAALSKARGE